MKKTFQILGLLAAHIDCASPEVGNGKSAGAVAAQPSAAVMERHALLAEQIRDAITRGDLEHAQRDARRLGAIVSNAGSPDYEERLQRMRIATRAIASAPDVTTAAHRFGGLAAACAGCHARLGGPSWVDVSGTPPGPMGSAWAMSKHAWAMNQMYNGLLYNSEAPWSAGADLLADRALWADEILPGKTWPEGSDRITPSLSALGRQAQATSDEDLRAKLYGELLATCGACHARTGGGPVQRWRQ